MFLTLNYMHNLQELCLVTQFLLIQTMNETEYKKLN